MKEPRKLHPEVRREVGNLIMKEQPLNRRQNQKVSSRNSCDREKKNRKFRSTPLKLRLKREKSAKKGQVVTQNKNIITGSVFMLMMALN